MGPHGKTPEIPWSWEFSDRSIEARMALKDLMKEDTMEAEDVAVQVGREIISKASSSLLAVCLNSELFLLVL